MWPVMCVEVISYPIPSWNDSNTTCGHYSSEEFFSSWSIYAGTLHWTLQYLMLPCISINVYDTDAAGWVKFLLLLLLCLLDISAYDDAWYLFAFTTSATRCPHNESFQRPLANYIKEICKVINTQTFLQHQVFKLR